MHLRILAGLFMGGVLAAQAPVPTPKLEAATIKVNDSGARGSQSHSDPARFTFTNNTLRSLVQNAFGLKAYQVIGPDWLDTMRYDGAISFSGVDQKQAATQLPPILEPWLTEQFKLVTHKETRNFDGYALVVAKGGSKLKPAAADSCCDTNTSGDGNGEHMVAHADMANLARNLLRSVDRPVVIDDTGLKGVYDFHLDYSDVTSAGTPASTDPAAPPPIFQALEQQLGLRLEARKIPIEVLVIDHAEKVPTGN